MDVFEKAKLVGKVFMDGAKAPLNMEWAWGASAIIGLSQGLKYRGSIKAGLTGGLATMGVITGVNGIMTVVRNWGEIRKHIL